MMGMWFEWNLEGFIRTIKDNGKALLRVFFLLWGYSKPNCKVKISQNVKYIV